MASFESTRPSTGTHFVGGTQSNTINKINVAINQRFSNAINEIKVFFSVICILIYNK